MCDHYVHVVVVSQITEVRRRDGQFHTYTSNTSSMDTDFNSTDETQHLNINHYQHNDHHNRYIDSKMD